MFRKHAIKEEVDPAYVSNSVTLINYNTSFNISLVTWKINITATDEKISKYSHEMRIQHVFIWKQDFHFLKNNRLA